MCCCSMKYEKEKVEKTKRKLFEQSQHRYKKYVLYVLGNCMYGLIKMLLITI